MLGGFLSAEDAATYKAFPHATPDKEDFANLFGVPTGH